MTSQKYKARMIPALFNLLEFRLKDQIRLGVAGVYRIIKYYILPQQLRIKNAIRKLATTRATKAADVK